MKLPINRFSGWYFINIVSNRFGVCYFFSQRADGRAGGSKNAPKMFSDFAETLVRCSLGPIWTPGLGTRLVRNSYISFQRPPRTRAFGNVTLKCELDQTDGGSVLVESNGGFWWVMFVTFLEVRFFPKNGRPRAPENSDVRPVCWLSL